MLAYVGPGAGFAITLSLLTFVVVIASVLGGPIVYPLLMLWHSLRGKRVRFVRGFKKVVVLGLDGLDPKIVRRLMATGRLPHFAALAQEGHFSDLQTVLPALTPAAWSSFTTGGDPSYHGIFDFITRDPATYLPKLSSAEVLAPKHWLLFGKWRVPLSRSRVRPLRKGIPFWHVLARHGLEVTVLRVPITFPPQPFSGRLLSGMCVPDLKGTQGIYCLYTSDPARVPQEGADVVRLDFDGGVATTKLVGPAHPFRADGRPLLMRMSIRRPDGHGQLEIRIGGQRLVLREGEQSQWVQLRFRAGPVSVKGLVHLIVVRVAPEVELYRSPIHLDPEGSPMRLSHPSLFSDYLAKRSGVYGTLGLAEDTSAMNDGVLDEAAFLQQAWGLFDERKRQFLATLDAKLDDVTICVFDTPDRIQHMFWRYLEPAHPARPDGSGKHADAIDQMVETMDQLLGETQRRLTKDTLLLVLSDHGFNNFARSVNLNAWLREAGYLHLKEGAQLNQDWMEGVDWSRTRAYAMGLVGLFINLRGREAQGVVGPGEECDRLLAELKEGLESLVDRSRGTPERRPVRAAFITAKHYEGPYAREGPDLLIGYEQGYRCSWECARGQVTEEIFADNVRPWSGDHCVHPSIVPGVLFSNTKLSASAPAIFDLAPTILDTFGLDVPSAVKGHSMFVPPPGQEPTNSDSEFAGPTCGRAGAF